MFKVEVSLISFARNLMDIPCCIGMMVSKSLCPQLLFSHGQYTFSLQNICSQVFQPLASVIKSPQHMQSCKFVVQKQNGKYTFLVGGYKVMAECCKMKLNYFRNSSMFISVTSPFLSSENTSGDFVDNNSETETDGLIFSK